MTHEKPGPFPRSVHPADGPPPGLESHPNHYAAALTSHLELSPDEIRASGVSPELSRYSAGIEDVGDPILDLGRALDAL